MRIQRLHTNNIINKAAIVLCIATALILGTVVSASHYSGWGDVSKAPSVDIPDNGILPLNTSANDGCPYQAPDGLSLYIASNRPGGHGGLDIWVALRNSPDEPWGEPINLPFNSPLDDFCPSPVQGHGLFFVSRRYVPGVSCNPTPAPSPNAQDTDIYFTRYAEKGDLTDPESWAEPQNVGCGVNSALDEWSPSYFTGDDGQEYLYFSRAGVGAAAPNSAEIYYSQNFGPAQAVTELNTEFDDHRPNVSKNGLEIVFDSTRDGFVGTTRNPDIWTATRECASAGCLWSTPIHLGGGINTPQGESRATLSWDGLTMFFGSARSAVDVQGGPTLGSADIYMTTREKLKGYEK